MRPNGSSLMKRYRKWRLETDRAESKVARPPEGNLEPRSDGANQMGRMGQGYVTSFTIEDDIKE